jgi:chromosome segregation ATPase
MNIEMFPPSQPKGKPMDSPGGEMINQIRDFSRRLRIIEERHSSLRKNIQVNEQNMLTEGRKFASEVKTINSEISELRSMINEIKEEMRMLIADVRQSVKKEELKVLEKYISLWEPLNFVTPGEVERIVRKIIDQRESKETK